MISGFVGSVGVLSIGFESTELIKAKQRKHGDMFRTYSFLNLKPFEISKIETVGKGGETHMEINCWLGQKQWALTIVLGKQKINMACF